MKTPSNPLLESKPRMRHAFALCLLLGVFVQCQESRPVAQQGVLNLDGVDIEKEGPIPLNGDWLFYRGNLRNDLDQNSANTLQIPSVWTNSVGTPYGYGTFRLRIIGVNATRYSFHLSEISTAYRIYVNGQILGESGQVAESADRGRPSSQRKILPFDSNGDTIEVDIEVSNYHSVIGGIPSVIRFGTQDQIRRYREWAIAESVFLAGAGFMVGAYFLLAFFAYRKDKPFLYFGLFCWTLALRMVIINEQFLVENLPSISWENWQRIETLNFFLLAPLFIHFIRAAYLDKFKLKILYILDCAFTLIAILILITEPKTFGPFLIPAYGVIGIAILYITYLLWDQVLTRKDGESKVILASFFLLGIATSTEMLIERRIILGADYVQIPCFFTFILSQAYVLSVYTRRLHRAKEVSDFQALSERSRSMRLEVALGQERERIIHDLHDHLGARLTDLIVRAENIRPTAPQMINEIDGLQKDIRSVIRTLRDTIADHEDIRIMSQDFLHGLNLNLLRRYANSQRELRFFATEESKNILRAIDDPGVKQTLYAITLEIATNDLKYGYGASNWSISDKNGLLIFKVKTQTNFRNDDDSERTFGRRSMRKRLDELNGTWSESIANNQFDLKLDFPLLQKENVLVKEY